MKGISGEGKDYYHDALNELGVPSEYIIELELHKGKLREILAVLLIAGVIAVILAIRFFVSSSREKKEKARSFAALDEINNDPLKSLSYSDEGNNSYNYNKINYGRDTEPVNEPEKDYVEPKPSTTSKFTLKKD